MRLISEPQLLLPDFQRADGCTAAGISGDPSVGNGGRIADGAWTQSERSDFAGRISGCVHLFPDVQAEIRRVSGRICDPGTK